MSVVAAILLQTCWLVSNLSWIFIKLVEPLTILYGDYVKWHTHDQPPLTFIHSRWDKFSSHILTYVHKDCMQVYCQCTTTTCKRTCSIFTHDLQHSQTNQVCSSAWTNSHNRNQRWSEKEWCNHRAHNKFATTELTATASDHRLSMWV